MLKQKVKILLAEDDTNLGVLLFDYLTNEGFEVTLCKDGEMALEAYHKNQLDICLLDIMMPKMDGFNVAKKIRLIDKDIPIIFITAKSLRKDKLEGYGIGADDYISKPFDEEELLWKIKAITRRNSKTPNPEKTEITKIGLYIFDYNNQSLCIGHSTKRLTQKESQILKYLSDHRNKVIRREELLKEVWGENDYFFGRSLDVFITKIRKYLKEDKNLYFENLFGVGFIFVAPPKK